MVKQVVLVALLIATCAHPLDARIVEETIELPVEVMTIRGEVVRQPIKVAIMRDDARARAPFLIFNHGRAVQAMQREAMTPARVAANARYFVARGFAVFMPVRIGYGATGGPDVKFSGACAARLFRPAYEAAAQQSLVVIAYAKSQPYVDATRGIVVGQSFGGATAIALAAKRIPGVIAAVNFAGGGGGRPDMYPGEPCSAERMRDLFAGYGVTARIPTLWLYSENDRYWGATLPREWHTAYTDRGGVAQFVALPPFRDDGHPSFTGNPAAWRPAFEAFLESCCK